VEHFFGHLERGGVAVLLVLHDARHALHALHQFGIRGLHPLGDEAGELVEERLVTPAMPGVAQRAAHDLAQHVAAAFVGRAARRRGSETPRRGRDRRDAQRGVMRAFSP
jgi:hypothetical protein